MPEHLHPEHKMPEPEQLLPRVKGEIGKSLQAEIDEKGSEDEYVIDIIRRYKDTNPVLNDFITRATAGMEPKAREKAMAVTYLALRLVEGQIDSNRLKKGVKE